MANPRLLFLKKHGSLAEQVAEALLDDCDSLPCDLSGTEVWVPTAGAARRIRYQLARLSSGRGGGVLSPKFSSPMKALLPKGPLASRSDREAAWGLVLQKTERSRMEHLFPKGEVLEGEQAILSTAGMLCDLCDLLAEGGITPLLPRIPEVCSEDEERWREIAPLYRLYLDELKRHTLWDPNEARIKAWENPPGDTRALVIACIPDLSEAARRRAVALLEQGIPVKVLVWKPEGLDGWGGSGESGGWGGGFDAWGRPDAREWIDSEIPISPVQIVMAKDPAEEASLALDFLAEAGGDHAIVLGDPDLAPAFQAEVLRRGGSPYLPDGEPLARTEAAVVAAGWIDFRRERSLRTLRRLLETPRFAGWIGSRCDLSHERLLEACDALTLKLLAETFPEAPIPPGGIEGDSRADVTVFQKAIAGVLAMGPRDLVGEIWKKDPAEEVLEVCEECSPVLSSWPDPLKAREASIVRALARLKSFGPSMPGDLEISGWLEAPWSEARRLVLCGCVEGRVPASKDGHPFLPDHKRRELGVPDNAARRARDSYLLGCLTRARKEFRCSFSKFGPDGSPSIPSALLMRCPQEELPSRVSALFGKSREASAPPLREHDWRWSLPRHTEPPDRISVTDFASYLQCPFRFYLKRRMNLREHDPEQREMDAMQFGSLVHEVLERYGRETPLLSDQGEIASVVLADLEREVRERFGTDPSPAVRVQVEAARVRLLSFARVQAAQVAEGWKILEAEYKSSGDLVIGGIPLSAKIDRIEVNGERVRVLDYKTQTSLKTPESVHLQPVSNAFFDEAVTRFRGKEKAWADLQLPLYRKVAEKIYPGKTIETAYFVLTADPEESDVIGFTIDEGLMADSLSCAEAAASRISRGVFWPPRQVPGSWEDPFGIFLEGGKPEECLDEATITFLQGRRDREVGS
jgi:ATP-dependent helicase/nuclease subunit B